MRAIYAYAHIEDEIDGQKILKKIETVGRTCYKSEGKVAEGSAEKFVKNIIKRGHEAMLEHVSLTIRFVVDRGISHELVRHRLASFAQESTRYCNYAKDDFGNEITFIIPAFMEFKSEAWNVWAEQMQSCENAYFKLLDIGLKPEEARTVLPNSLKTEVVMTANLREWRHFFNLRAANKTGKAHPQMLEVTIPLLRELKELVPVVFDDITYNDGHR